MLNFLLYIIELILLVYMVFNVSYVAIYAISAFFYTKTNFNVEVKKHNRFALLIPAYKSDEVIINTASESLKQDYPADQFEIIVIADQVKQSTIDVLLKLPIKVIPVTFEESTKAKSLNAALAVLPENYDYSIIIDVDNVMEYDFLKKMNIRLQNDEVVLQGHRTAKNLNTTFAVLDGLSEELNNQIFRKGHVAIGVSAALSGSGAAMKYGYFKELMSDIHSPVEDKELEMVLLKEKIKIYYENDALIYDEKVQSSAVFINQRRRWIASQFFDFNHVVFEGAYQLIRYSNFDYFDKTLQKIVLPRVLLYGVSLLLALTVFFDVFHFGDLFLALFLICTFSYLICIPVRYFNVKTFKAAFHIPQAFALMVLALFKSKGAATKKFIHTPHDFVKANNDKENS